MRSSRMRLVLVCALLVGAMHGTARAARVLDCADYVSTTLEDAPGVGHLIGTKTVTHTYNASPGGIGVTVSETFQVGVYDFGGSRVMIDCRDYRRYQL
ncbi:MAG: hypothetical protein ACREL7_13495 [Longimicrobiales bacterium]